MTDEQIWLLRYGRRWIDWWEFEDSGDAIDPIFERMHSAGMLESDRKGLRVRLKPKEENESIRV